MGQMNSTCRAPPYGPYSQSPTPGSDNPRRAYGQKHRLMTAGVAHVAASMVHGHQSDTREKVQPYAKDNDKAPKRSDLMAAVVATQRAGPGPSRSRHP
jgi:hypothetical protein